MIAVANILTMDQVNRKNEVREQIPSWFGERRLGKTVVFSCRLSSTYEMTIDIPDDLQYSTLTPEFVLVFLI